MSRLEQPLSQGNTMGLEGSGLWLQICPQGAPGINPQTSQVICLWQSWWSSLVVHPILLSWCLSHSSISSRNTRLSSLNPKQWWIAFSLNSVLKIVGVYVPQMKFLRDLRPIRCLSLPVDLAQLDPILCFPALRPAHCWWFTELEEAGTLQRPSSLCSWLGRNSESYMSITGALAGDTLSCLLLLMSHTSAFPPHRLWPFHTCWGGKEE